MVCVGVREQYRVELWQGIERNSWRAHARKKLAECRIKIGVGEKSFPSDLN
jgi:hypothetical protein